MEFKFLPGIPPLTEWTLIQYLKMADWFANGLELKYIRAEATWISAKALIQYRKTSSLSPIAPLVVVAIIAAAIAAIGLGIVAYYSYKIIVAVKPAPEVMNLVWVGIGVAIPVFAVGYLLKRRRKETY